MRIAGVAVAAALLAAAPAVAHTEVVKRTPGPGKTLDRGPKKVTVKFSQQIRSGGSITVSRGGAVVLRGGNDPRDVTRLRARSTKSRLPEGSYTVRWSATALDGHEQGGGWTFTVA